MFVLTIGLSAMQDRASGGRSKVGNSSLEFAADAYQDSHARPGGKLLKPYRQVFVRSQELKKDTKADLFRLVEGRQIRARNSLIFKIDAFTRL